jgi:hypothetical protein
MHSYRAPCKCSNTQVQQVLANGQCCCDRQILRQSGANPARCEFELVRGYCPAATGQTHARVLGELGVAMALGSAHGTCTKMHTIHKILFDQCIGSILTLFDACISMQCRKTSDRQWLVKRRDLGGLCHVAALPLRHS